MRAKPAKRIAFRWRVNQLHRQPLAYYTERLKVIPRVDCPDRVVVTFTTIPERIGQIEVMLKSLLDQSALPDSICLCIPKTSRLAPYSYSIPSWFSQIPILNIVECEQDLGPVTKLIPTWQQERHMPDTRLIIVDDDGVYPYRLIEQLISWSQRMPDAALGCSGVAVPAGMKPSSVIFSRETWLQDLRYTSFSSDALARVDYLFGYAGVLVKPRFFDLSRTLFQGETPGPGQLPEPHAGHPGRLRHRLRQSRGPPRPHAYQHLCFITAFVPMSFIFRFVEDLVSGRDAGARRQLR